MASKLILNIDIPSHTISKHVYGHFAEHLGRCIYDGMYVGEDSSIPNIKGWRKDVVAALKELQMPNLRWPGGCFADTYHWMDGIGPKEKRPSIVNIHWGGVTENNHVGTHEFFDLCELLSSPGHECEPYICGNVGSGTPKEMAEWLEYITQPGESPMSNLRRKNGRDKPWKLKYWAIGNENWGCGGDMRAQFYCDLYRQFSVYARNFNREPLYKIACGLTEDWNQTLLQEIHGKINGLSVHYYTLPIPTWQGSKGSSTNFDVPMYHTTLHRAADIEKFIQRTAGQMDRWDLDKKIGIIMDEWGTWYDVEPGTNPGFLYQQNTQRDALVAALSLNIFNKHADRVHMANIAQTVNVLQAMILTEGDKMLLTPTYHVFEMFKKHQDAMLVPTYLDTPDYKMDDKKEVLPTISASASKDKKGNILLTLANLHHSKSETIETDIRGGKVKKVSGRILSAKALNTMNTFDKPSVIAPKKFEGAKLSGGKLTIKIPAASVVALEIS